MKRDNELAIGVDLGGTKILVALVNRKGKSSYSMKARTFSSSNSDIADRVIYMIHELLRKSGCGINAISAIGIGAAGLLDPDTGVIYESPNMKIKRDYDLKTPVEREFLVPVFVDNDVNLGTYGEYVFGAGKGVKSLVGIFVGTGIGGGIVLNGDIYHGFTKAAGELGHIIINFDGRPHPFKTAPKGTLEAYAGRIAIVMEIKKAVERGEKSIVPEIINGDWQSFKSGDFKKALEKGDKVVAKALNKASGYLGIGIASIAHVLSPEMVVLGGGIIEAAGSYMLPRIIKKVKKRGFEPCIRGMKIVEAEMEDESIVVGAATLAFNRSEKEFG